MNRMTVTLLNFSCLLLLTPLLIGCGETEMELTDVEEQTPAAPAAPRRPSSLSTEYPVGEFTDPELGSVIEFSVGEEPGFDGSYVIISGHDKPSINLVTFLPLTKKEAADLLVHLNVLSDEFLKLDTSRAVKKRLPAFSLPDGTIMSSVSVKDGKKSGSIRLVKSSPLLRVGISMNYLYGDDPSNLKQITELLVEALKQINKQ